MSRTSLQIDMQTFVFVCARPTVHWNNIRTIFLCSGLGKTRRKNPRKRFGTLLATRFWEHICKIPSRNKPADMKLVFVDSLVCPETAFHIFAQFVGQFLMLPHNTLWSGIEKYVHTVANNDWTTGMMLEKSCRGFTVLKSQRVGTKTI